MTIPVDKILWSAVNRDIITIASFNKCVPSSNTQITLLTENHVVINSTVRKGLEPDPIRRAHSTLVAAVSVVATIRTVTTNIIIIVVVIFVFNLRCKHLTRLPNSCHASEIRRVFARWRRQGCKSRYRGKDARAPEETFARAIEVCCRVRRVGEVCAEGLLQVSTNIKNKTHKILFNLKIVEDVNTLNSGERV